MIAGQLYRITIQGRERRSEDTIVSDLVLLMVAGTPEDALSRFPWVFDLSEFDDYAIISVDKEPERIFTLSSTVRSVPHSNPDAVIERKDRTDNIYQRVPTPGIKYKAAMSCVLYAASESSMWRKFNARLKGNDPRLTYFFEEMHVSDGIAKPRDVSIFTRAHIINLPLHRGQA